MNAEVSFGCSNGNDLIGSSPLHCLPSGRWSAPIPACQDVVCPESIVTHSPPSLQVHVESFGVGGRVNFGCVRGHVLSGPETAFCRHNGSWSIVESPRCTPVSCPDPAVPVNGFVSLEKGLQVGGVVKYHCKPGYMMDGLPMAVCADSGMWSNAAPRCKVACSYPGSAIGGRVSNVRFYYAVGESVDYECMRGKTLEGARRLECLGSGMWSGPVPNCVNDRKRK